MQRQVAQALPSEYFVRRCVISADSSTDLPISSSAEVSSLLTRKESRILFGYIFLLTLLYDIAGSGVSGLAMQFILKNTLHLTPAKLSFLGFLTDGPVFVAFAFGFLRDRWSPFRKGDRGYFLLLPPLLACANLILAFGPFTYGKILGVSLLITACGVLLGSAVRGLMTVLAQIHGMAGRLSVLLLLTPRLVGMIASAIGGHLAVPEYRHLSFLISAALCLPVIAMAFWKPRAVFAHARENNVIRLTTQHSCPLSLLVAL